MMVTFVETFQHASFQKDAQSTAFLSATNLFTRGSNTMVVLEHVVADNALLISAAVEVTTWQFWAWPAFEEEKK